MTAQPLTDVEIAQAHTLAPISEIATKAGVSDDALIPYGKHMAKVDITQNPGNAPGKLVVVTGVAGSGKSSLMAVLSGLERASGGSLMVAGADFATLDEDGLAAARRGRIGIVLQAFHLLPTMTAAENVATPMELAAMPDASPRALAELEAVGLGHRTGHYPTQLSGGEQQRVAIARATAPRPGLIFADEPTGNLDAATGEEIIKLLFARRAETGATLLIITHDASLAAKCERVLTMADGVIVSDTAGA